MYIKSVIKYSKFLWCPFSLEDVKWFPCTQCLTVMAAFTIFRTAESAAADKIGVYSRQYFCDLIFLVRS